MEWTTERTDRLRELFALGLSASQIAAQLGGVTRNAVIGKQNRLGLSRGSRADFIGPRLPRKASRWHLYKGKYKTRYVPKPRQRIAIVAAPAPPEWRGISLFELTNETCRFPSHEPPFFYCGVPEADCGNGRPYCPYHHNITHWNPNERIRAPRAGRNTHLSHGHSDGGSAAQAA